MIFDKSHGGYIIAFEKTGTGYSAYVPDLPGCIAAGKTLEETKKLMNEAIPFHIQGTRKDRLRVPRPRSLAALRAKRLV